MQVEISNNVVARLQAEQEAFHKEIEAQGRQEGLAWARSASYIDLVEMFLTFTERYAGGGNPGPYYCYEMVNDPKYGSYWEDVFQRYPIVAKTACLTRFEVVTSNEANYFISGWHLALEDFYLSFTRRIAEVEKQDLPF